MALPNCKGCGGRGCFYCELPARAVAYLLLIIDTKPLGFDASPYVLPEARRMSVDIFGEEHPTLGGHCRSFVLAKESGDNYSACCKRLLDMVDDDRPTNRMAWVRPLLSDRARRCAAELA